MSEKSWNREVNVYRATRPVTYFNPEGHLEQLGEIAADEFQEENLSSFVFLPSTSNPWAQALKREKGYSLGSGSSRVLFVNPAEPQQLFLDRGWEIKHQYAISGGLQMVTQFIHPDYEELDPDRYDVELWGERGALDSRTPLVEVTSGLALGQMAVKISFGVYRLICTNGLTVREGSQFHSTYTHRSWDVKSMEAQLSSWGVPSFSQLEDRSPIADLPAVQGASRILREYADSVAQGKGVPKQFQPIGDQFHFAAPDRLSRWALDNYLTHLKAVLLHRQSQGESVSYQDLVNAYTSGVNQHRLHTGSERGVFTALGMTHEVVSGTARFAQFVSLFRSFSDN